jgi:hypothetical protein
MSDTFENNDTAHKFTRGHCHVAYTINNSQPVICTIIGDQPLFYMDMDISAEDEGGVMDDLEMGLLEKEIGLLRQGIKSLDRLCKESGADSASKIEEFHNDLQALLGPATQATDMNALKAALGVSRLATSYMDFADQHNISVEYSSQVETALYDRAAARIQINPALDMDVQKLLLAQELRRHWQHRAGALIHPLMFHPDNAILVNRAQIADLAVSMVRIAWELQLAGDKSAWERIENSSMADLGRAFAREAFLDFRTINNGLASAAVFECWFLSERCRAQDKIVINQMLADQHGYVFDLEHTVPNVTPSLIAALGSMPFGKNYLSEHAATILEDTIFTDVRDRSNANFLWFIKFERSFRETEQELQTQSGPTAKGVRPAAQTSQDQTDAPAQIVQLFATAPDRAQKPAKSGRPLSGKAAEQAGGSNVIYLRRWSGD